MAKKENNSNPDPKKLKLSAEAMERLAKAGFDFSESVDKSSGFLNSISSQLFGISKNDFFDKVKHSAEDFSQIQNEVGILSEALEEASAVANKGFTNVFKSIKKDGFNVNQLISSMTDKLSKEMPEIAKEIQDAFDSKNLANLSDEAMKEFQKMVKDKEGFGKLSDFFEKDAIKDVKQIKTELSGWEQELASSGKEAVNLGKAFNSILERLTKGFNLKEITTSLIGFDKTLTKAQMDSGILFKENTTAMADLTSTTQQFGMGIAETTELMGNLGSTLRTTNFEILSQAAGDMAAVGKATGISATEVGELGGQMMLMGKSSKDVSKFAESTMKSAMNFGVNGRKVMQDIVKNIPKFRQMGFQGGEDSLKRMALQAERMGQNIDEMFDMSKKARNIEGALQMASDLQLAGGSFANINPMDLLSAARKGPEELQKILGQMGGDIGKFDKATGQMAFDAVDYDRLQMVADATGMSVDSLQKQITTMNQDAQKTELLPPGLFDSLKPEEKAFLLNNMGKDGTLNMKMDGVDKLGDLQSTNIQEAMKQAAIEKGNLEDQAKQNTSFEESVKNLKDSIMNVFVVFEPVIKALTRFVQWLNAAFSSFGVIGKTVFAVAIAGLALLFSSGKQFLSGFAFGKGQKAGLAAGGGGISSILGGKKGGGIPSVPETGVPSGAGEKTGGGLKGFATAIKDMSKEGAKIDLKGILKLSTSILLLMAPIGILAAVFSKVDPVLLLAFGGVMVEMSLAMLLMSKMTGQISIGNVLKGALAMVIMGAALIPFGYAMTLFSGISWEVLGVAAVAILGASVLLAGLGFFAPLILMGALALAAAGVALMAFGGSLLVASYGFEAVGKIDWSSLSGMGAAILTIASAGALGLVGSFGLIGMSFALGSLAAVMVVLAPAMQMAALSTNSMAEGIGKLKEAVKGLDVEKLNSLAGAAEKLSTGSAISGLANTLAGVLGGGGDKGSQNQKVKIEPITINIKMNGRDLQQIIIEDNKLSQ